MKEITYIQADSKLVIDGLSYVGEYDRLDDVWSIAWTSPDSVETEWTDGRRNTLETGPYPHPSHIDEWAHQDFLAKEMAELKEIERLEEQEEWQEKEQEKLDQIESVKEKIAAVFENAGNPLDADELRLIFGQEI